MPTFNESIHGVLRKQPQSISKKSPIIFVHGAMHAAWCWDMGFADIFVQQGYDCYLYDLPGHGKNVSKKSLRWLSINDYVKDLEHVANNFSERPILIGHSMGVLIIQKYLEDHSAAAGILLASILPRGFSKLTWRVFKQAAGNSVPLAA